MDALRRAFVRSGLFSLASAMGRQAEHLIKKTSIHRIPSVRRLLLKFRATALSALLKGGGDVELASSKNPDVLYRGGVNLAQVGRHVEAADMLRRCLELKPEHIDALLIQTQILTHLSRHREAFDLASRAIRINPHCAPAFASIRAILPALGETEDIETIREQLIDAHRSFLAVEPDDVEMWKSLGSILDAQRRAVDLRTGAKRRSEGATEAVSTPIPLRQAPEIETRKRAVTDDAASEGGTKNAEALRQSNEAWASQISSQHDRLGYLDSLENWARYEHTKTYYRNLGLFTQKYGKDSGGASPEQSVPLHLYAAFSMNGRVPIESGYLNSSYAGHCGDVITDDDIYGCAVNLLSLFPEQSRARSSLVMSEALTRSRLFDNSLAGRAYRAPRAEAGHLIEAFSRYRPGRTVASIATLQPWIETLCIAEGLDVTRLSPGSAQAASSLLSCRALTDESPHPAFDGAVAYMAVENAGLGRLGDTLDPDGDRALLRRIGELLAPRGKLFLFLPVGRDAVVFNAGRIYGRVRLPYLLESWDLLDTFGFESGMLNEPGEKLALLVLKRSDQSGRSAGIDRLFDDEDRAAQVNAVSARATAQSDADLSALLSVNDALRTHALSQLADIERALRFVALSVREMEAGQWRYYSLCRENFGQPNPTSVPPVRIPDELMDRYTMNGKAIIEYNYLDATYPDNWPLIYTDAEIDYFFEKIKRQDYFIYGMTDVWMWEAIGKYPIRGKSVVNMGSLTPWYESNCLYFGANSTTIDYNRIITATSRIRTMTVAEWNATRPSFDIAWSISSFEHDGLGMYGDPLDPDGDLKAMKNMKNIVRPGGLLFLSVPVGRDKILFNNARIYGRVRLPMLMEGWDHVDTFGLAPQHLDGPGHIQPVFILRNPEMQ